MDLLHTMTITTVLFTGAIILIVLIVLVDGEAFMILSIMGRTAITMDTITHIMVPITIILGITIMGGIADFLDKTEETIIEIVLQASTVDVENETTPTVEVVVVVQAIQEGSQKRTQVMI